jgi:phosphatidylinositol alpha-1,6-mannosyltransferase
VKVLFVTRKWPPAVGGMETYSYELCKAMKDKVDLQLFKLPGKEDGAPPSVVALALFFIHVLFHVIFNGRHYDIIHIGDFVLAPIGVVAKLFSKKSKVLIMIHGLDILYGNRTGLAPSIYRVYQKLMVKMGSADHFIANSENTGRLCNEAELNPVTVIPLGVNVSLPAVENNQHDNTILFLGRLVKRKGALWFATNVMPLLGEQYRLKVVGKVWDVSEQAGLINCKNVDLIGYVSNEDLFQLKQSCMLAVMPNQLSENNTDVEGFGLVAAELSVQGVPIIASNIEGLTSAVIPGKTGFLVESDNVAQWQQEIENVAKWDTEQRSSFCITFRNETIQYFSWQRVADDTVRLYESLISQEVS